MLGFPQQVMGRRKRHERLYVTTPKQVEIESGNTSVMGGKSWERS